MPCRILRDSPDGTFVAVQHCETDGCRRARSSGKDIKRESAGIGSAGFDRNRIGHPEGLPLMVDLVHGLLFRMERGTAAEVVADGIPVTDAAPQQGKAENWRFESAITFQLKVRSKKPLLLLIIFSLQIITFYYPPM